MVDRKLNFVTLPSSSIGKNFILNHQWKILPWMLVILDALMVFAALNLAYFIRFKLNLSIFRPEVMNSPTYYLILDLILVVVSLILFRIAGLYHPANILGGMREYSLVFNSIAVLVVCIIFVTFLMPTFILSRGWLGLAWFLTFLAVILGRFIFRRLVYLMRARGYYLKRTMIIGVNEESRYLSAQMQEFTKSGMLIVGFVDDGIPAGNSVHDEHVCLGSINNLEQIVEKYQVEEIILTTSALTQNQIVSIFQQYGVSKKVTLRLTSGLYEIMTTGVQVRELAGVPLLRVNHVRLTGPDLVMKTLMDYLISTVFLLLLSPLMIIIIIAIKLDSPGPIFHRRKVLGVNGGEFHALKFRSMYVNGDKILDANPELKQELERNHKLKNDPRITRIGAILRKFSLDELPQFLNVLGGQMSVVGPRMISPGEISEYSQLGMNLLTVKPGITGLWQISGRSDVSYSERVRLDMYYVRNWSIWLDVQILLRTIPAVLSRRGAY